MAKVEAGMPRRNLAKEAYKDNATLYSEGAKRSAEAVLKIVFDLVRSCSAVDVGCSIGSWLAVCISMGVTDILGLDGEYVDRTSLLIPADKFLGVDLSRVPY